jgi:hypothetical protein
MRSRTRTTRKSPPSLTPDQQEVWEERMAICTIDGGLSESEAQAVAWAQLEAEYGVRPTLPSVPPTLPHVATVATAPPVVPSASPAPRVADTGQFEPPHFIQEPHHAD